MPLDFPEDALSLMDSSIAPVDQPRCQGAGRGAPGLRPGRPVAGPHRPGRAHRVAAGQHACRRAAAGRSAGTKLALAEEFNTIGDSEGARTLVEEVIAESSGELKARAQRLLATLS
ncbi:FimV N-terminal domain protein [Alicycliphilus sp. B1]|nr:FimV N-terminal domain protein [Alicycliphilus sp. B1]